MKKLLLVFSVVALLAAGCDSASSPTSQQITPTSLATTNSTQPVDTSTPVKTSQTSKPKVKSQSVQANTPTPTLNSAPTPISIKNADIDLDTYLSTEATMQGVVFDLVPSNQFSAGDEIMLEDEQYHSYMVVVFNVDPSVYQNLNLGNVVQVKGTLGAGGGPKARWVTLDGDPIVVGHSSSIPSPATVLSDAQSLVHANQADIQNALQNVGNSTSFNECAQINDTLISDLCSTIGGSCLYSGTQLPLVYKDSVTVINNAVKQVVNACIEKWQNHN
jgi:hypothetical protein